MTALKLKTKKTPTLRINLTWKTIKFHKKLKKENYNLFKELENHKRRIEDLTKSNGFSTKSTSSVLNPLKEDLKSKITKLEKKVNELETENHKLLEDKIGSNKQNESKGNHCQRENLRLKMKINELEHKLYQAI